VLVASGSIAIRFCAMPTIAAALDTPHRRIIEAAP